MGIFFNKLELDVATEILNIGLAKAADSLSFFAKEKVLINGLNIKFTSIEKSNLFSKKEAIVTALSTQLEGDIEGYCYLIFAESEVNKLAELSLHKDILNDPMQSEEMKRAILIEVDNIITGAVVTQFSNLLSTKLYGLVPTEYSGSPESVKNFIRKESKNENYVLQCSTSLVAEGNNLNPEFLWCLDKRFVEEIKEFVSKSKIIKELVELH